MTTLWNGLYAFDAADAELTLLPMAARRALDLAGLHLSLADWQRLSREAREQLVLLGASQQPDVARVHACLATAGVSPRRQTAVEDPQSALPTSQLMAALGPAMPLTAAQWQGLRVLDRYVLAQLARRGKQERLAEAYAEIVLGVKRAL